MTAGTVVITGGILAAAILLCIIAVLCYCRLQYYCCKKEESDEDEEEPDFAMHSRFPPGHYSYNVGNGPNIFASPYARDHLHSRTLCASCSFYEQPYFLHQLEEMHNGGERVSYNTLSEEDLEMPLNLLSVQNLPSLQSLPLGRPRTAREAFSRSRSISTDV
ncbi:protein FAM163B [Callorhinchus milii]|uniref:Family with sequence similarity 163 member B n=1 Tax=Callorhinchus milii TaxID=7868 RepID=V9L9Z1_CALMI|nr:protein FAM163B [Callorhinchus milii]XP_007898363.1 protein FAM163B [Callorhinchus milii]|eukprot:gi/632964362/ref/XP_007898362.1/ PREDICTED: protein FAM163B [Callorhinchus milii]